MIKHIVDEVHNMSYFFLTEIEEYFRMAGFELMVVVNGDTLKEPRFDSWTVYFVGKKF